MLSAERLKELLASMGLRDAQIEVEQLGLRLVGSIVSPDFEGVDEADRQALVWGHLYEQASEWERRGVEFVFTSTPEEEESYKMAQ
jgi:acid stress-induced BolA-like protein IbaG/YrbA